jgi:hypothetical protein
VFVTELFKEARQLGISQHTLRRSKDKLGVRTEKDKGDTNGQWKWRLPSKETLK